jgi:hypothetical protein
MSGYTLGLPLRCPKCPPKHYFGTLKGDSVPTQMVKFGKADVCPNCRTPLVNPKAA